MSTQTSVQGQSDVMSGVPISIRHVSKTFGEDGERPFRALGDINIDIQPGEFISVVGPSGCGKSTLMLMVAGLLERSQGDIVVGAQSVNKPITDVGIAFQDHLLLDFRTAMDNVMLQADVRGLDKAKIRARATELFEQLRLTHAIDKYPRQLSGGMRQRVSLVRTLVHDPSVILMDEPFGALDALTRARLQDELLKIVARTRSTVVMVTHDVDEAVLLSDRVVMMTNGPAATIGEILSVNLPRPRDRVELAENPDYVHCRKAVLDFLYTRQGHVEKASA